MTPNQSRHRGVEGRLLLDGFRQRGLFADHIPPRGDELGRRLRRHARPGDDVADERRGVGAVLDHRTGQHRQPPGDSEGQHLEQLADALQRRVQLVGTCTAGRFPDLADSRLERHGIRSFGGPHQLVASLSKHARMVMRPARHRVPATYWAVLTSIRVRACATRSRTRRASSGASPNGSATATAPAASAESAALPYSRPVARKYAATATRRAPAVQSSRTASPAVGAAAEAYPERHGTPRAAPSAVATWSTVDSAARSRVPAAASTSAS